MKWLWLIGVPLVVFFAIWMDESWNKGDQVEKEPPAKLYFRVARKQCKQIDSLKIEEVDAFLHTYGIPRVCGQRYGSWVPVAINERPWRCFVAKDERLRRKLIAKMSELGIETSIEPPVEED